MLVPLEIHDLLRDASTLKTLPQVLGIRAFKLLSYALILTASFLTLMTSNSIKLAGIEIAMLSLLAILIFKVKTGRQKYITSLLVEAIPVLWLGLSFMALTYF